MIILTTPTIKKLKPKRQSRTINWVGGNYCLAEVADDFTIDVRRMKKLKIEFWEELVKGLSYDVSEFNVEDHDHLIEGVIWEWDIQKPGNMAKVIYEICRKEGVDPIDYWNKTIKQNLYDHSNIWPIK